MADAENFQYFHHFCPNPTIRYRPPAQFPFWRFKCFTGSSGVELYLHLTTSKCAPPAQFLMGIPVT